MTSGGFGVFRDIRTLIVCFMRLYIWKARGATMGYVYYYARIKTNMQAGGVSSRLHY